MSKEETPIGLQLSTPIYNHLRWTISRLRYFNEYHPTDKQRLELIFSINEMFKNRHEKNVEQYAQAKVEELQKENKHLKQVYEHRCNEVKDKVETIHNYFNQITKLQKGIDKAYEALNDIVWLIERGASMDEVIESVNAKARPFLLTNKKEG
jgi:uncharacterized coiled-coil DUF342 family protein